MPFDKELDKELFLEVAEFEKTKIKVGIYSYNDGQQKMQVSRENMNAAGEPRFAKLGRMTKEEAEKVIPLMQKALENMQ